MACVSQAMEGGVEGAESLIKWEDKLGIKEGCANLGKACQALFDQAKQEWENPAAYEARMEAVRELERRQDLFRRAFDAENYHLHQDKILGYAAAEMVQLLFGGEIIKGVAKGASKGVQFAKRVQQGVRVEEGVAEAVKAAASIEKGVQEVGEGVKLAREAGEGTKGCEAIGLLGRKENQAKTAYEIAKEGGKHAGMYRESLKLSNKQLTKAIRSFDKNIVIHENLMKEPAKYLKEYGKEIEGLPWKNLHPERQKILLEKKWPSEIKNFKEQIEILKGILNSRK